jgi:hypothetical protein
MILNLGPLGASKAKSPPAFTYTGAYELKQSTRSDGTVDWELALTSSGTLTFTRVVDSVDIFLVGPGANGQRGYADSTTAHGGKGGNGGQVKTVYGKAVTAGTSYSIVIGSPGTATSGFSESASSGGGKTGGAGATAIGNNRVNAGAGTDGTKSFGGTGALYYPNYYYGASGGGGGARSANYTIASPGIKGDNGAGDGGSYSNSGGSATRNSGSGGGGGGYDISNYTDQPGGAGGSGIIIIRNAR